MIRRHTAVNVQAKRQWYHPVTIGCPAQRASPYRTAIRVAIRNKGSILPKRYQISTIIQQV